MPSMDLTRSDPGRGEVARTGSSRRRVLTELRQAGTALGLQELAERTGLHENTVRFHLDRLAADGLVLRGVEPPARPGRPRVTFTAAHRPDLDPRWRNYRLLAEMLAGLLAALPDPEQRATDLGRAWGRQLTTPPPTPSSSRAGTEKQAVAELLRVLDDVGFAPEHAEEADGHRIVLRHCPFLEVAEAYPQVACAAHLGLMQGVLGELSAPLAADELRPFAVPAGCVAHARRLP